MTSKTYYSVSEVTQYIKSMLDTDSLLSNIYIQGELSNVKYHYSGHVYFTLKDPFAVIKGVMFKSNVNRLPFL
jgi:exodeoxyribonuclease VII large subunit